MIIHTVILSFLLFHYCRTQLYNSRIGLPVSEIPLKPTTVSCCSFQAASLNIISVLVNFALSFCPWCEDAFHLLLTSCFTENDSELQKTISGGYQTLHAHLLVRQYRCVLLIVCNIRIDSRQFIISSETLQKKR